MTSTLDLLVSLCELDTRRDAAARLASHLQVEDLLVVVRDPVVDAMMPAQGMPQTLRGGREWRNFLAQCMQPGRHAAGVDLGTPVVRDAIAVSGGRAAVILVGGVPREEDIRLIERVLPMLAAVFGAEQEAAIERSSAQQAQRAASRAHALATALEAARAEGSRLNVELRREHDRKDEFLAMLAHELRNPLAPIVSSIEVLRHPDTGKVQHDYQLTVMTRQVGQLSRLVDDLLDVSRVSRGRISLRRSILDLRGVIHSALETSRPVMLARGHSLSADLPHEPVPVDADPVRLTQVFSNLLHNAAKYTDPGGRIRLTASVAQGSAVVEVQDNGIGIAPQALSQIFDLFMQVPVSLDRAQGGLGIGLTLVRTLTLLHGGEVSARSDGLSQGSTFTVSLPLARASNLQHVVESIGPASASAAMALRVLIVDDNRDGADSLATILQLKGHSVEVAYSAVTGLQHAEDAKPDLVLLDLGLPELDGFEVGRRMRMKLRGRARIVALTGYGTEADRQRTKDAGFDEHRVKPLSLSELDEILGAAATAAKALA